MTDHSPERQVASLRAAADFIEASNLLDLPAPYVTSGRHGTSLTYQLANTAADDQRGAAQRIIRAIGGEWRKWAVADDFYMSQTIDGLDVTIMATRDQVCTRRVVGTEQVVVPAVEARPARVETREVVEWDCSPVLAEATA